MFQGCGIPHYQEYQPNVKIKPFTQSSIPKINEILTSGLKDSVKFGKD